MAYPSFGSGVDETLYDGLHVTGRVQAAMRNPTIR